MAPLTAAAATVMFLAFVFAAGRAVAHAAVSGAETERVSANSAGEEANGPSDEAAISADGRFVAFSSAATNLVPGDTNEAFDIFVRDREPGTTERISVTSAGAQTGGGGAPAISANGRYVAFVSAAADIVPGDDNGSQDVFVHDRRRGTTELVSARPDGSAPTHGGSWGPALTGTGRLVAFGSSSGELTPGDVNRYADIFVRDLRLGATELVSVDSSGSQADRLTIPYETAISAKRPVRRLRVLRPVQPP